MAPIDVKPDAVLQTEPPDFGEGIEEPGRRSAGVRDNGHHSAPFVCGPTNERLEAREVYDSACVDWNLPEAAPTKAQYRRRPCNRIVSRRRSEDDKVRRRPIIGRTRSAAFTGG